MDFVHPQHGGRGKKLRSSSMRPGRPMPGAEAPLDEACDLRWIEAEPIASASLAQALNAVGPGGRL